MLFVALGLEPRFAKVSIALIAGIIGALMPLGIVSPNLREKAELTCVGRFYAAESMLVWGPVAGHHDPDMTPEFGMDTLDDHYRDLAAPMPYSEQFARNPASSGPILEERTTYGIRCLCFRQTHALPKAGELLYARAYLRRDAMTPAHEMMRGVGGNGAAISTG